MRAAADGAGGVVLLEGAAGTGKSRLLLDATVVATAVGLAAAVASADSQEELVPFSLLIAALGGPQLAPPVGVVHSRSNLLEQLRADVEERVAASPLLVVLDDLQWADAGTLHEVQALARRLDSYPLLWLLAGRPGGVGGPLARMFAALEASGAQRVELTPLPDGAVALVLTDVVGAEPQPDLLELAAGGGGNPGLLVDLAEGLLEEGAVQVTSGLARLASSRVPDRVQAIVAYRLGRLSPEARHLLEVAAALGRAFSVDDVAAVVGEPTEQLLPVLQVARDAGVLIETAGGLGFRHDLVRSAVYEGIPEPLRLALHRQIGGLMLERGGSAVAAASHLLRGATAGDGQALVALDEAAAVLLSSSPEAAADLALRALELTPASVDARLPRTVAAVDALMAARRLDQAMTLATEPLAAGPVPSVEAARLHLRLSSIALMRSDPEAARAEADTVLAMAADLGAPLHSTADMARLMALLAQPDLVEARRTAETILGGTDGPETNVTLAGALTALGSISWMEGRVADSIGFFRAAVQRIDRNGDGASHIHPRQSLAVALTATGEFEQAEALLREDGRESELTGNGAWAPAVVARQARLHLAWGRLIEAAAEAEAAVAMSEEVTTSLFVPLARSTLAAVALFRGDLRAATEQIELCRVAPAPSREPFVSMLCTWMEARAAATLHGAARAVEILDDVYGNPETARRLFLEEPAAAPWLVRTALAAGDRHRAERVVACVGVLDAENLGCDALAASSVHARGLYDRNLGALSQAAEAHRHPWASAAAAEDGGALLAEHDWATAQGHFERALGAYDAAGADQDAVRMRARLGTGERRRRRDRPVEGWGSLTNTERRVSGLVAQGLTNPEVAERMLLSRHTVDFHLRQIFRKLNVHSRVELTRLALRHEGETLL